jgi:5-methylcytosine-specific restriction endonuclease McrA
MNQEELCQPCRDAQNVYRRQMWANKPEVYRNQAKRYKERHPDKIKQAHKKYNLPEEVKQERKLQRSQATALKKANEKLLKQQAREKALEERKIAREAKKNDPAILAQKRANQERAWEISRQRLIAYNIEKGKINQERREKQKVIKEEQKRIREEERERRLLIKKLIKLINKRIKQELNDRHGVSIGDYQRCRKVTGKACDLCRAIAAEYVRNKYKTDPKYKEAEKRWRKENPDRAYANRHRAKKYGVPTEYYTKKHIFDRDGYDCYLCNTPVDLTAPHIQGQPGWEKYPHIEHVIPISKGGPDTKANVKIAHAKCNIDKGVELLQKS